MSNNISQQLLAQFYGQESGDPLLMLITLSHASFDTIYLASNTVDVVSRGNTYIAFPMSITLPTDDGESERQLSIEFDNVSLELIEELRTVTTPMDVKVEMILASNPDIVEMSYEDLKMRGVNYDKQRVRASLFMDSFLNVELPSERYTSSLYPGIF